MKLTHTSIVICLIAALSVCGLNSCKPGDGHCPGPSEKRWYLFNEYKHLNPYHGYDTVKFRHNSGNIYTFTGQGIDSGFSVTGNAVSPDCPDNILEYRQFYKIVFQSVDFGKIEFKRFVTIGANSNSSGNIGLSRNGVSQYVNTSIYDGSEINNTSFFDSLSINNKIYYRVITMRYNNDRHDPRKAYLNAQYGILKITDPVKGDTLERMPD